MVKKLTVNCSFKNGVAPIVFYVGESAQESHPIQFQSQWLAKEYGGKVPKEIMDSLQKLKEISKKNRVSFVELCNYVFKEVNAEKEIVGERNRAFKQSAIVAKNEKLKQINDEQK